MFQRPTRLFLWQSILPFWFNFKDVEMHTHAFCRLLLFLFGAVHVLEHKNAPVARSFSTQEGSGLSPGENVIVPLIANSLEFTLSSPPPLHQFQEPPLIVETEHLQLFPGKECEEVLKMQGVTVTDIIGKEMFAQNDPAKYEGLMPQNEAWTEFVDEKTGEWVYLDEYGDRVEKPV
jgi:hypothetical protein